MELPTQVKATAHIPSPQASDSSPTTNGIPRNSTHPSSRGLNVRSCNICRRRKVKCDKQEGGCRNCLKANAECSYPGPGRASRRPKPPKTPTERESELLKRLRRLEGVVEELSGQVELEAVKASPIGSSDLRTDSHTEEGKDTKSTRNTIRVVGMDEGSASSRTWLQRLKDMGQGPMKSDLIGTEFGRLVIDEGKSRYVNTAFWASMSSEVDNIRELFDEAASDDLEDDDESIVADTSVSPQIDDNDHQSFIFGYSSAAVDLRSLHPLPSQIPFYFETFKENVDPLIKIFHLPTMTKTMKDVQNNLGSLSKSTEALCFSIYYATITSMSIKEVSSNFGIEKALLLKRYRFGIEQALARAHFLITSEIVTLQAFVLFIACVRRFDDSHLTWTLTGLAIRVAQSLGLHRDGIKFDLTPFDTEMRRRLWWQIVVLDTRTAEDLGAEPSLTEMSYDTKRPLNINDADIEPTSTEAPSPLVGVTEMSFSLIRFELCITGQKISSMAPIDGSKVLSLGDKELLIRECHERLESSYLKYCENAGPLFWVAATIARLIVAKWGLIIYLGTPGVAENLPSSVKKRLLIAAIEILEFSRLLETEATTKKWGWLFHTYVQWHSIAYILSQILTHPHSDVLERGWRAVNAIFEEWDHEMKRSKNSALWMPMRRLMTRATAKHKQDLAIAAQNSSHFSSNSSPIGDEGRHRSSISDDHGLNPIRPLQQGLPVFTQALQQEFQSVVGPFYNQQPALNGVDSGLAMQYQQINGAGQTLSWATEDMGMGMDGIGVVEGSDLETNWGNFDDLVRDFQMGVDASQQDTRGPSFATIWF